MPHIESTQPNQAGCYKPRHDSWTIAAGLVGLGALYMWHVNSAMKIVPEEARKLSPHRWTSWTVAETSFQGCSLTEGFKGTLQGSTNKLFAIGHVAYSSRPGWAGCSLYVAC
jgi:hypothetical protein